MVENLFSLSGAVSRRIGIEGLAEPPIPANETRKILPPHRSPPTKAMQLNLQNVSRGIKRKIPGDWKSVGTTISRAFED
jgi:hypothetical protein